VLIDVAIAVALAGLTVGTMVEPAWTEKFGEVPGWCWPLVVLPPLVVAIRRTAPATALVLATAAYVVTAIGTAMNNGVLAAAFLTYTVAASRPVGASRLLVLVTAVPAAATLLYGEGGDELFRLVVILGTYAVGWVIGVRTRESLSRSEVLEQEAADARAAAEAVALQAVEDERARIASELHDAVGHAVNVMVMQAGAARLTATDERTLDALRNIERVGRASLADLDTMLGLLRPVAGSDAPREPAHRLSDVAELVAGVRAAGLDVALRDETEGRVPFDLDGRVGSAAYRIVQESLTNITKHAGPASAEVVLRAGPKELVVLVTDDGRGPVEATTSGGGRGIVGMRERVHVLGGRLEVGPRTGGGFRVEAHIPLERGGLA